MRGKNILALGADIKNRMLWVKGKDSFPGPDLYDLSQPAPMRRFKKNVADVFGKAKTVDILAHDAHPGYFSTRWALTLKSPKIRHVLGIQHHQAHIASVLEEHHLKRPVIGVALDGTGYGTDGHIWGGEFFQLSGASCERLAHFRYLPMPGGDKCIQEPWRMVVSLLGEKAFDFLKKPRREQRQGVLMMIKKNIQCPLTSSVGRLFDAAAALLGIAQIAVFEAQGSIKLEALCNAQEKGIYPYRIEKQDHRYLLDVRPAFLQMARELRRHRALDVLATRFHNTIADMTCTVIRTLSQEHHIRDIALSGGVFQNNFLRRDIIGRLQRAGCRVWINEKTPVNDLNISLGQYYVSCHSRKS